MGTVAWAKHLPFVSSFGLSQEVYDEAVKKINKSNWGAESFEPNLRWAPKLIQVLKSKEDREKIHRIAVSEAAGFADRARTQRSRDLIWYYIGQISEAMDKSPLPSKEEASQAFI
jgi:hypothetical protein